MSRDRVNVEKRVMPRFRAFQARNAETAPAALERLRRAAIANKNRSGSTSGKPTSCRASTGVQSKWTVHST